MKTLKVFASALAAIIMVTSCSKEESNGNTTLPGEAATLSLTINGDGDGEQTRATGETLLDNDVNDLTVFIFRADGTLDCPAKLIDAPQPINLITCTTLAKDIYTIANLGEDESALVTAGVTTKAQLLAKTADLINGAASTQTSSNVYMEGSGTIAWVANEGIAAVTLSFVGAKIEVVLDLTAFVNPPGASHIDVDKVVLLYAGSKAKFFSTTKGAQTAWYSGDVTYPDYSGGATTTSAAPLEETLALTLGLTTNHPHFYLFANDGAAHNSILAIKGIRTGDSQEIFWPVTFGTTDTDDVNIEAGHSYQVAIKLTGTTADGGTVGGTETPETPVLAGTVSVTVTTAAWTPKLIIKDFH